MAESECNSRFSSVSEEDIATLQCDKDSLNTKMAAKVSVGVLQLYRQPTNFISLFQESSSYLLHVVSTIALNKMIIAHTFIE